MAGTHVESVTLPRMLDVAHVMLVEAFQSVGMNLVDAIERVRDLGVERPQETEAAAPPDEVSNEESLRALEEMMKGVSLA